MQDNLFWGALVTSVCLLFVEHLGRWADSHRSTYWMRPWYFLLNLCPASLVITLAIKFRHVPAWLIGSYEVVWVQAVGLQVKSSPLLVAHTNFDSSTGSTLPVSSNTGIGMLCYLYLLLSR